MTFRQYLNETPLKGGNLSKRTDAKVFSKTIKEFINDLKPTKPLFDTFKYTMTPDIFVVFKKDTPVFYIVYSSKNKMMKIKNVENVSNIKDLSFKVYSAILHLKIFNAISTGNILSTQNIKAHKKYLLSNIFNLYIDGNLIDTEQAFDKAMKTSHEFILKNSGLIEGIVQMYDTTFLGKKYNTYNAMSRVINDMEKINDI